MKAQDFLEWMKAADVRFAADISRLIGIERTTAQRWLNAAREGEDIPVRRPFALAMAAVALDLQPWGGSDSEGMNSMGDKQYKAIPQPGSIGKWIIVDADPAPGREKVSVDATSYPTLETAEATIMGMTVVRLQK